MLNTVLKLVGIYSQEERDRKLYDSLVRHEARVGGKLFGPVPPGTKREFYCLNETGFGAKKLPIKTVKSEA
jgi:hypothetical protein